METLKERYPENRQAGFSIIELMVVVVIMTIVLAASIPALRQHSETVNLTKGSREVESSLKLARTRAVSTNIPVVVVFDTDNGTYFLFEDEDEDGNHDSAETSSGPCWVRSPGASSKCPTPQRPRLW